MKSLIQCLTNWRYWVLIALLGIAIVGLFCVPDDELPMLYYLYVLITSKVIGIAALWGVCKLLQVWERKNAIPALFAKINDDNNN